MTVAFYLLTLLALGIYSYSQIDLNLTLFQFPAFLSFQNSLIQLGYFNRPLSTTIFLILLFFLSVLYVLLLRSPKNLKILIVGVAVLGILSYPAFSHDIFNYIFDARIFAYHGQNPYQFTALDFPGDTWTRFMNWTHRTYPYGPTFLPITIFFYLLGFNKFVLTLLSFKAMILLFFLSSTYLLFNMKGQRAALFFALNPLIIFEVIIGAHLDIIMLFFALFGWNLLSHKKNVLSFVSLLVSIGIKYSTILLLPAFIIRSLKLAIILAFLGALFQALSREILPHYLIVPIGFVALASENKKLLSVTAIISIFLLLIRYYPFISTGEWTAIKLLSP